MDDPTLQALLNFIIFEFPRTPKQKPAQVRYDEIIGGDLTPDVVSMLALGTQQRRLLVQGLTYAGTVPNPANVIESVDAYLPSVWHIQKSLEFSKDTKIKINKPLEFIWTSSIANPEKSEADRTQKQGVFVFEVTFVLIVRAVSHFNLARQLVEKALVMDVGASEINEEKVTEGFKQAIKELRIGAGVLEFAADEVLSQWRKPPKDPLPENRVKILKSLALFFLCQAQRIFLAKAIIGKKYGILPVLFLGLSDKCDLASKSFINEFTMLGIGVPGPCVDPQLYHECQLMRELCKLYAYKYSALAAEQKLENNSDSLETTEQCIEHCVGFMTRAVEESQRKDLNNGVSFGVMPRRFGDSFKADLRFVREKLAKYEHENATVYFSPVDMDNCELPPRSQYKFLMAKEDFTMPTVKALSFEQMIIAPAGMNQRDFIQLPKDIQEELVAEDKQKKLAAEKAEADALAARQLAQKNQKTSGGLFGLLGGGKRPDNNVNNKPSSAAANDPPLEPPPGIDKAYFGGLPREIQLEFIEDYRRKQAAAAGPSTTNPSATNNGNVW